MKNGLENKYIIKNNKKLYFGYTTGSCAAASAKAGTLMLFTGNRQESVKLMTPKGIELNLKILDVEMNSQYILCAVKKDSGDDPDVTNGILVYTKVSKTSTEEIKVDGGLGVGKVTKEGLEQAVGSAAINKVPRKMIMENVKKVCEDFDYHGGIHVEVIIPEGVEIAKKTFNPRLGIEGGISVLGTSGIVEPMSEAALIESIRVEMKMKAAQGYEYLIITPGNYGTDFSLENLKLSEKQLIKCSNYVGETMDIALELGIKGILFVSHIGKFIKVAGGIMNTHSAFADSRLELIAANAARAGADIQTVKEILDCISTDEAVAILMKRNLGELTIKYIIEKIQFYLNKRSDGKIETGIILFSNAFGKLGNSENISNLLENIKEMDE